MKERVFTAADILSMRDTSEIDPFGDQLRRSYFALLMNILHNEGHIRQFRKNEYRSVATFLAGHNGNPLGFALFAALRRSVEESIPFVTHIRTERVIAGNFNEQADTFDGPPWNPLDDEILRASYHEHRSSRYWEFHLPQDYPHALVKETQEGGQLSFRTMYRPAAPVMIPGVFLPADVPYPDRSQPSEALRQQWQEYAGNYQLRLGTFLQFALEAFSVLCPAYHVPGPASQPGTHLLEIFLQALYGSPFSVGDTSFHALDQSEKHYPLPEWAQRWTLIWLALPPGTLIGKAEIVKLVNLLGKEERLSPASLTASSNKSSHQ